MNPLTCSGWEGSKLTPCRRIFQKVLPLIWTKGIEMDTHFCAREKKSLHLFRLGETDIQPLFEKIILFLERHRFSICEKKSSHLFRLGEPVFQPSLRKNFCLPLIRTGKGQPQVIFEKFLSLYLDNGRRFLSLSADFSEFGQKIERPMLLGRSGKSSFSGRFWSICCSVIAFESKGCVFVFSCAHTPKWSVWGRKKRPSFSHLNAVV